MVDLKYQKRMAAEVMKCGTQRIYLDPNKTEDISEAVTRTDIKSLIKNRVIIKKQKKGVSRGRARYIARQKKKGKRKGPGSRKGAKYARFPKKRRWIQTIRPLRRKLKEYRDGGYIDTLMPEQSELYEWVVGNRRIAMPPSGADPAIYNPILLWITQGALDN